MASYASESEDDISLVENSIKDEDPDSLKRCGQALGISVDYVPTWSLRDGFREFFQNWFVVERFPVGFRS